METKFLETITLIGDDILIPIDKIEYVKIYFNSEGSYSIFIKGEGQYEWAEIFDTFKKATVRYEMIKKIIGAK